METGHPVSRGRLELRKKKKQYWRDTGLFDDDFATALFKYDTEIDEKYSFDASATT
jgi:hypothetical protein